MRKLWWLFGFALIAAGTPALAETQGDQLAALPAPAITVGSIYWGTGFFVDRDGHVLTAYHLVSDCASIDIVGNGGREQAAVVASNPVQDITVLRAARSFGEPVAFDTRSELGAGAMVAIIGYRPLQDALRGQDAARPADLNSMTLDGHEPGHLALVSDAEAGASGSPVITPDGLVAGVLQAKLIRMGSGAGKQNETRLALDAASAREFLRSNGIAPLEGGAGAHARLTRLGEIAAAEVKIECRR